MEKLMRGVIPLCMAVISLPALSQDIRLNGFATIAAGTTGASDESAYGYEDVTAFDQDSLLGLQASSNLGDGLEATVQIKAEGIDGWEPTFEWAYIGYRVNDSMKVLFGKQRHPFYLYSDYLDVGYAYHWVTPPRGVYDLPFDSIDGASMLYTTMLGDVDTSLQFGFGRSKASVRIFGEDVDFDAKNMMSVNATFSYESFSFRFGRSQAKLDMPISDLQALAGGWLTVAGETSTAAEAFDSDPLRAAAIEMAAIPENITYEEDDASFTGVGVTYDDGTFFVVAEATLLDLSDGIIGENRSQYISAGIRINDGRMTLHGTIGTDDDEGSEDIAANIPRDITGGASTDLDTAVNGLIDLTNGTAVGLGADSRYLTLGVRWDFHSSAALKFDVTRHENKLNDDEDHTAVIALTTVF